MNVILLVLEVLFRIIGNFDVRLYIFEVEVKLYEVIFNLWEYIVLLGY